MTGHGLAANLRKPYPPALLHVVVVVILVANVINIGADIWAMAATRRVWLATLVPSFELSSASVMRLATRPQ